MKTFHVLAIEKTTVLYEIKARTCEEAMAIYHGKVVGEVKSIGSASKTPSLECIEIGGK